MPAADQELIETPILLLAPSGNDARNAAAVLGKVSISSHICTSMPDLCQRAGEQAGALVISEEALDAPSLACLQEFLSRQPPWSDIPLVLVTTAGDVKQKTYAILDFLGVRANVTLLEKPLRAITLVSVIKTALRARNRQYEIRNLLESYSRAVEEAQTASAKFKAVFEQSSVFAGIMTLEGTVIEANWLCLEVCGYRAEDVIGKPFWECGWWRGSKEVQEKLRVGTVRAAGGTAYAETLPYLWADGTQRVVEFGLHPIRDDAGHVIYLHPTGVDVTDRQKAEARAEFLIRLTQKLSIVSDPSEINRIATREIGQFLGADRCYFCLATPDPETMEVLPDWHRDGDVGFEGVHPLAEFGQPELWQKMRAHAVSVDDVRTHPLTKDFLSNYQRVNILAFNQAPFVHEGRWVACVAVSAIQPRQWTANEMALLENAVARVWPLIERARVESALREANALLADKAAHLEALVQQRTAKLRETIGELESFSYSIAHDLRSPLRSLQGFSDILLTDYGPKLGSECQRFLQLIAAAASRMDRLIQDVLSYSQVVRAEWPLETVDVGQLLREIVETYPMFAPDKAEILFQGPFPRVLGGEALLTQVFSNLLGNAVKFVAPGVKPQLKVWAERKGGWVRLLVRDNGIGIAADQHEKIFAIFQRANKAYEGTGIGLAIVKKAVERLGGKVGLQSELGRGSTFWVEVKQAPDTRYPGKDTNVVPH